MQPIFLRCQLMKSWHWACGPTFLYTNNYASSKLFHLNTNADLEQPFLMLSVIGPKPNLHHFRITHQWELLLGVSKISNARNLKLIKLPHHSNWVEPNCPGFYCDQVESSGYLLQRAFNVIWGFWNYLWKTSLVRELRGSV